MKKNQIYRLCLKSGDFETAPTFKIKVGKFEKTINTYFIAADKQRYNYDLYLERNKQPEILFEVFANQSLVGTGKLKFDSTKNELPNQIVEVMNKKQKIGIIQCSLKKIQKKVKKPAMKINIIQAAYTEDLDEVGQMDPFIVIKYADNNYKTKVASGAGKNPVWKEQFHIGTADNDRIFLQSWQEDADGSKFIGVSIVDIATKMGGEHQVEVTREKTKKGVITFELTQHTSKRPDHSEQKVNDKNYIKKRNIKTYAVEAVLKNNAKKGGFIRIQVGDQQFQTTPIFKETAQLKWNQSFTLKGVQGEQFIAKLCIKDDIEEQIGRCTLNVIDIVNKNYELAILDADDQEMGKLYLQFYDEDLDIKQEMNEAKSEQSPVKSSKKVEFQKKEEPSISPKTQQKINNKHSQIKARYANRQSIHDYMAQVNSVLEEGLLRIAKDRPEDPIKQLGLFLINYKK